MITRTQEKNNTTPAVVEKVEKQAKTFKEFITKFNNDWSMNFAGLIAYNLLLAMLPLAIALLAILGFIFGNLNPGALQNIVNQLAQSLPGAASSGSQQALTLAIKQLSKSAGILGLIAVLLAIFGGSRLFIVIEGCFDIIYRVRPRDIIRQNIMAISMLILFIILVPIMIFASSLPTFIFSIVQNTPIANIPGSGFLFSLGGILGGLISAFILFEAFYCFIPNQRISWHNSWRGALLAAIAMIIFFILFPLYITHFLSGYAGQIGFAVILLLFFYYFAVILMFGAEINAYFLGNIRPLPNDLVTFISTMAGKLNQDIPETELPHTNEKPTEQADSAHVTRTQEVQNKNGNQEKEEKTVARNSTQNMNGKNGTKAVQHQEKSQSKINTLVEVTIGSIITVVIEMFRLRQKGK